MRATGHPSTVATGTTSTGASSATPRNTAEEAGADELQLRPGRGEEPGHQRGAPEHEDDQPDDDPASRQRLRLGQRFRERGDRRDARRAPRGQASRR